MEETALLTVAVVTGKINFTSTQVDIIISRVDYPFSLFLRELRGLSRIFMPLTLSREHSTFIYTPWMRVLTLWMKIGIRWLTSTGMCRIHGQLLVSQMTVKVLVEAVHYR